MAFKPITKKQDAARAFDTFKERFANGARVFHDHQVGYQGGAQRKDVYWSDALGYWGLFEPSAVKGRFWICFGLQDPADFDNLSITVEINPPIDGVNRRCAGMFLRDLVGKTYIAHSGKVGGGAKRHWKSRISRFLAE